MKKTTLFAVFGGLLSVLVVSKLLGDSWSYPTGPSTYYSSNKIYALTVTPPPAQTEEKCVAVLKRNDSKENQVVWQATLVNPVTPLAAMITNTGNYVVTFDTWGRVGTDPIVIYDSKGQLVHRHSLESLGLMQYVEGKWVVRKRTKNEDGSETVGATKEGAYIKRSVSSTWWQENAIRFFANEERYLIVRLHWGMLLGIDLSTGRILGNAELNAVKAEIDENMRREALLLLASDRVDDQLTGAIIAGQEKYPSAIPLLRELLKSKVRSHQRTTTPESTADNTITKWKRISSKYEYYVRKAGLEALTALGEKVDGVIIEEDAPWEDDPWKKDES